MRAKTNSLFSHFSGKQGLIATQLSVLEALIMKVDENIHPGYYVAEYIHPWLLQHMCTVNSVRTIVCTCTVEQPPALNNCELVCFLTFN